MAKILYLQNGRASDQAVSLFGKSITSVPVCSLPHLNLLLYDVLIIPSYSNQDILYDNQQRIETFLKYGGIVVALGAIQNKKDWLSCCTYHDQEYPKNIQFLNRENPASQIIFGGINFDINALNYHDTFFSHGTFGTLSSNTIPLLSTNDTNKLVLSIVHPRGVDGKLLITTLDPDHHTISGQTKHGFIRNHHAEKLFEGIIDWAEKEIDNRGKSFKRWRRIVGLSNMSWLFILLIGTLAMCIFSILGFLVGMIDEKVFSIIASISSITSLGLSVRLKIISKL